MTWCAETKRAFMNDDNRDMYIEYLVRCKLANKTILAYTAPLKGLFKYVNNKLNALGTHITFVSPWEGNNLNIKNKVKKRKVVLPDNEMIDLLRHAKASNSLIYAMCYMLYRFGLRLDALMTLKLSKDSFTYESKGQRSRGMFAVNNEDIRLFELHKDEFHTMTTNAKRARIIRFIEKAVEKGIISERITPHCFRHSFANKNLSEGKTHKEVSDMMNHKSFISIDSYVDCYSQITNKFEGIKLDI
jgi:site-specific recombinase XerD